MTMAERELASFISAVTELYGVEQAKLSAEVWLDELESTHGMPGSTNHDWRAVTMAASARVANRLLTQGRIFIESGTEDLEVLFTSKTVEFTVPVLKADSHG
jgi:hypothetical protein